MLDIRKVEQLYAEALHHARHTPQIGGTLVGNCTTVHFGMLGRTRELFGQQVQFVIGHITLNGVEHFNFSPQEYAAWVAGAQRPTYALHAWLSLPHHDDDLIDLTLADTLRHRNPLLLHGAFRFLVSATAAASGIEHHAFAAGDDLLFRLHMVRGIRDA